MKSIDIMSSVLLSAYKHLNSVMFKFYKILSKTEGTVTQNLQQNPLQLLWAVLCQHCHRSSVHTGVDDSAINKFCQLEIWYAKFYSHRVCKKSCKGSILNNNGNLPLLLHSIGISESNKTFLLDLKKDLEHFHTFPLYIPGT